MKVKLLACYILSSTLKLSSSSHKNMSTFASSSSSSSLSSLCLISKQACDILTPLVKGFYTSISGDTSKLKADASYFTIADGLVQHLLVENLFNDKFANIVGEEEGTSVNIVNKPYTIDDLTIPEEFNGLVESSRDAMNALAKSIDPNAFKSLTVFIDPIDGTREFSTGLGEQCSICIGFADASGKPVAGIVYRPITTPTTWASGAKSENFINSNLDVATVPNPKGFLTSNGGISKFIGLLIDELGFERVPSGGAGNKMLMLLEGKGAAYIQDRGVSRWDTCGAEAVIEAYGGTLSKLNTFVADKSLASYTYLKSPINLDFESGMSNLTPYNAADKNSVKKGEETRAITVESVKAYSNLCGLIALDGNCVKNDLDRIHTAILKVKEASAPSYD